jgi:toxin ParE1/3/4
MNPYSVAPAARSDLREIWKYIARDNEDAATRMRGSYEEAFLMLAHRPHLGQTCEELRAGLRFFCVGNYVIYYELAGHRIRIVRVLHGARDVRLVFSRES